MKHLVVPASLFVIGLSLLGCSGNETPAVPTSAATRAATAQNDGPPSATVASAAPTATTAAGPGTTAVVQEVSVRSGENGNAYFFQVSNTNLKTGKVKVTLTNAGPERFHTFVVKKADGSVLAEVKETQPGLTNTVEFDLSSAGTYQFQCDLRGHADRGQTGSFTVAQ